MRPVSTRWLRSPRVASDAVGRAADAVRCVAFWTACLGPLVYLPLFARWRGDVPAEILAAAVVGHAVALLVGHDHHSEVGR